MKAKTKKFIKKRKILLIIIGIIFLLSIVAIIFLNSSHTTKLKYFGFTTWITNFTEYTESGANAVRQNAITNNFSDSVIKAINLNKSGITPLYTLRPKLVDKCIKDTAYCCNNFELIKQDTANYTYSTVKNLKDNGFVGQNWEFLNEANYYYFCDESQYTQLLKIVYENAKRADPKAVVFISGVGTHTDDLIYNWFGTVYRYGGKDYFDVINIHPYCYDSTVYKWVNGTSDKTCKEYENIIKLRDLMDSYGDKNKKIWISETGLSTKGCGKTDGVYNGVTCLNTSSEYISNRENNQAIVMNSIFKWIDLHKDLKIEAVIWYNFKDDNRDPLWSESNFGLIRLDGSKKPAYFVFENLTKIK
jgi:hypothetical protein